MSSLINTATIKIRRDTASNWTSNNPVLNQGEFCLETDSLLLKIGDGATAWTSLGYMVDEVGEKKTFFTYKDRTARRLLPFAFDNAVSTTIYSALYAEVGDMFEQSHLDAGDSASGAGLFYPTPVPSGYGRSGLPDVAYSSTDRSVNYLTNITHHISRSGTAFKLIGDDVPLPLVSGTKYYIYVNSATEIGFATTEANAIGGVLITLTDSGSGTFRLTQEGISIDDSFQGHWHQSAGTYANRYVSGSGETALWPSGSTDISVRTDTQNGTPRTANETRPSTFYQFGYIRY